MRATISEPDERSQWEWWAMRRAPALELRNHGVYGERTDEIAARLEAAVEDADALVVQGGINDVAQGRAVEDAERNLREMLVRGRAAGLRVALADVLPWPNGDVRAAREIVHLNELIEALAAQLDVPLLRFHDMLVDPEHPGRMRDGLTDDGSHPSVEGHRLLGGLVAQLATSL